MTRGVLVLDPARDLKGATPEKLAKALFRRTAPLKPEPDERPFGAMRSRWSSRRPTRRATVSNIWTRVSEFR